MGLLAPYLERRATLKDPARWLLDWFGGGPTAAGKEVNETTALNYLALYACVTLVTDTVASLPLVTYRRLSPQGRDLATEHPTYRLLHDAPNPEMTSMEMRECLTGHIETWGNAYINIDRDELTERPRALWPLRPDRMRTPQRLPSGQLVYPYTLPNGQEMLIPSYYIMHWRGLSPDGYVGYSRIRLAREAIGLGMALEEYGARFFSNDSRPGGVLEHPGKLSEPAQKRLKENWEELHRNLENKHRVAILEEGMKWHQIGLPNEDAQFLQSRRFQLEEMARLFRIPPHMIGDTEKSTSWGTGIEEQKDGFNSFSLTPRLVRVEQRCNRDLFRSDEQGIYYVKHRVDGLLRGNPKARAEALHIQRQDGIINADEWRELEDMNPQPGGQGSRYLINGNMIPVDQAGRQDTGGAQRRGSEMETQP